MPVEIMGNHTISFWTHLIGFKFEFTMIRNNRVLALERMPMPNLVVLSPLSFSGA
jgi:hypothetical protein